MSALAVHSFGMSQNLYYYVVSILFFFLFVLHLARIMYSWEAVIGGAIIPMWFSWAALIIAGYLCVRGWMFAKDS